MMAAGLLCFSFSLRFCIVKALMVRISKRSGGRGGPLDFTWWDGRLSLPQVTFVGITIRLRKKVISVLLIHFLAQHWLSQAIVRKNKQWLARANSACGGKSIAKGVVVLRRLDGQVCKSEREEQVY